MSRKELNLTSASPFKVLEIPGEEELEGCLLAVVGMLLREETRKHQRQGVVSG